MPAAARELPIDYEPRLVEEAVLAALRGRPEEARFRARRDALYAIPDPEERETRFRVHHADWFERLGLGEPMAGAIREHPSVQAGAARFVVLPAGTAREEGAELFVAAGRAGAAARTVVLRLRPETFRDLDRLRALLRQELTHVADMLDPHFGYDSPGASPGGRSLPERLLRERYRILWDARVDGHLARRGWTAPGTRTERLREFTAAFPMLGTRAEEAFDRLAGESAHTHADLLAFAAEPERMLGGARRAPRLGEPCPLCECSTYAFEPEPERLPAALRERIHEAFPLWAPADGLCRQCADLFAARAGGHPESGGAAGGRGDRG